MKSESKFITIKEAMELLGVSRSAVQQLSGIKPQIQKARDPESGEELPGLLERSSVVAYKKKRDRKKNAGAQKERQKGE